MAGVIISLDELKAVAKSYGYKLVKNPEKVNLLPCICGRKRLDKWTSAHEGWQIRCPQCNRTGPWRKTLKGAKIGWNERVTKW